MSQLPNDRNITYQLQYRNCGKPSCCICRTGQKHGPYWYDGSRLRSGYVGKVHPDEAAKAVAVAFSSEEQGG